MLVDDEGMLRASMRRLLSRHDDLCVVAEAADGSEALTQARTHQPDIAVVDHHMPGIDGTATIGRLLAEFPTLLAIGHSSDPSVESEMRRAGAVSFVLKGDTTRLIEHLSEIAEKISYPRR